MTGNDVTPDRLAEAVRQAGHGQFLAMQGSHADQWLEEVAQRISAFQAEYEARHGERPDPFALLGHPIKAAAFFHPTTLNASPRIQVAIWRILTGCDIRDLEFTYHHAKAPRLTIHLETPYGKPESYESDCPRDARVIRHFGMTDVDAEGLIIDGYYAPRD